MFNSMAIVSGLLLFALFANGTFACFPSSDKEPPEIEVKLPEPTVNVTVCEPQAYDIIFGLDNDVRKDHYEAIGEQIYKFIEPLKLGNGPNETRVAGLVAGVSDRVSLGSFSTAPEFIRAFRGVALKPNTGQSDITDVMQKAAGEFTKKSKERKAKNVKRVMILFYGNNGPVRPVSSSATYALAGDMAKKASVFTYVFPYGANGHISHAYDLSGKQMQNVFPLEKVDDASAPLDRIREGLMLDDPCRNEKKTKTKTK